MIKILVVDDSAFMRKILTDMLNSDSEIEVVGTANNGLDAIKKTKEIRPDVMTLDFEMPEMDGLTVLKKIMNDEPLPIILLTGTSNTNKTIEALNCGAVDFLLKPSGVISLDIEKIKSELIEKVKAASKSTIKKSPKRFSKPIKTTFGSTTEKIIVMASSTGGPQTLEALLTQFPKNLPAPILIVQHMPAMFTKSLAERLNKLCEIEVKEAKEGDLIKDGVALIAPGDFHMEIKTDFMGNKFVSLNQKEPELGVRPNANKLFLSAAEIYQENTIGVVLTGMGSDGTIGCSRIKGMRGLVIAESKESCIIYGMPKSIVEMNLADMILPLEKIPVALLQALDV